MVGRDLLTVGDARGQQLLQQYLAGQLASVLGVSAEKLTEGEELHEVASRYIGEGNRVEDIYPALKTITSRAEVTLPIPEPLLKLAAIRPLRFFVTTTFDSMLARALNQVRFHGEGITRVLTHTPGEPQDLPKDVRSTRDLTDNDPAIVYHLFGKVSATPAFAVTQEDYVEFFHSLQSDARRPPRLFDELNRQSLLILGCGFGGWLTRFLMRMSKGQRLSAGGKNDYVADVCVSRDENLVLFFHNFSRATKVYRSGGVLEFVDELHRRWMDVHPALARTQPGAEAASAGALDAGAIFLSYATEDRLAATKIKAALEAAGIDVFFDRDDLQSGEDWEGKLRRSIQQCSLFVPIVSRSTMAPGRRFFRVEWNLALEEAQMAPFSEEEAFLLPVVIDDTTPDKADVPPKFRAKQWTSLPGGEPTPEFVSRVQQLYRRYQKARSVSA